MKVRVLLGGIKRLTKRALDGAKAPLTDDDIEEIEWHELYDDINEAVRIGELIR